MELRHVWIILTIGAAVLRSDGVLSALHRQEMNVYEVRISVLNTILVDECPMYREYRRRACPMYREYQRPKRLSNLLTAEESQKLMAADHLVYFRMYNDLVECRQSNHLNRESERSSSTSAHQTSQVLSAATTAEYTTALAGESTNRPLAGESTNRTQITTNLGSSVTQFSRLPESTDDVTAPSSPPATPSITKLRSTTTTHPVSTHSPSTTPLSATTYLSTTTPLSTITPLSTTTPLSIITLPPTTTIRPQYTTPNIQLAPSTSYLKRRGPSRCPTVERFTEAWRLDSAGSDTRPGGTLSRYGYACDLRRDFRWFRFAGAAGNKMLNNCPKMFSCGTKWPIWTDAKMPQKVGIVATVNAYEVGYFTCTDYVHIIQVMRCSESGDDLIYRFVNIPDSRASCSSAFCGMI